MSTRWMSTGYLAAKPQGDIDADRGVIEGVSVCTEGEAQGHGVFLEESFIDAVVEFGNEKGAGLKARFGHPNMCSTALGTFLGRFKNLRKEAVARDDGSKAHRAIGDLFLSNSAKETPNGDLYSYVVQMANSEADMFGTSIVFTPGEKYRRTKSGKQVRHVWQQADDGTHLRDESGNALFRYIDENGKEHDPATDPVIERDYAVCEKLHACDVVDDPAANDGLFSRFAKETAAGQITEFLDLHPQVWQAVTDQPEILEAISRYGDKIEDFIKRYEVYRATQGAAMQTKNTDAETPEPTLEAAPGEFACPDENGELETIVAPDGAVKEGEQPAPDGALEAKPKEKVQPVPAPVAPAPDPVAEFKRMKSDFGADIAATTFEQGGDYAMAQKLAYERARDENAKLREQLKDVAPSGGTPAEFSAVRDSGVDENGVAPVFKHGTRRKK